MDVTINGIQWQIVPVKVGSEKLMRSDGTFTVGMTDNNTKCVYMSDELQGKFYERVLCHELVHCASFSYNCDIDIDTEEIIADFMSLFGQEICKNVDEICKKVLKTRKMAI